MVSNLLTSRPIGKQIDPNANFRPKRFFVVIPFCVRGFRNGGDCLLGGLLVFQRGSELRDFFAGLFGIRQRLLPALQQIYAGWASLKGYSASIKGFDMLVQLLSIRGERALSVWRAFALME